MVTQNIEGGRHRLWLSARALVLNNSGSEDLWLSATGAVVNGGRWPRVIERAAGTFCSGMTVHRAFDRPAGGLGSCWNATWSLFGQARRRSLGAERGLDGGVRSMAFRW